MFNPYIKKCDNCIKESEKSWMPHLVELNGYNCLFQTEAYFLRGKRSCALHWDKNYKHIRKQDIHLVQQPLLFLDKIKEI